MVTGESPAGARRRLRIALRKAREAKGFTQGDIAQRLDWSLSKVQRIEAGEVTVSSTDVEALLSRLDITDTHRVIELVQLARTSRRKGWSDEQRYREYLTAATAQLLQFECEARAIRTFQPTLIPGILQTRAYAEYIFDFWKDELSVQEREVRLEVRLMRRQHVLDRPDPPDFLLVLDESVLLREPGGRQGEARVMAEQLRELVELMRRPTIFVRIVPLIVGANLTMLNSFSLLDLGDDDNDDSLLYREAQLIDEIEQSPERIKLYRSRFDRMWDEALTEDATSALIEERIAKLLSLPPRA